MIFFLYFQKIYCCPNQRYLPIETFSLENCFFFFFIHSNSGSAIYVNDVNQITLKNNLFNLCISSNKGGAIYIQNSNFNFFSNLCFSFCKSPIDPSCGQALYVFQGNFTYFNYTSAIFCWNTTNSGDDSLCLCRLSIISSNINCSNNYATSHETSALHFYNIKYIICYFINLINNEGYTVCGFYFQTNTFNNISYINFINNRLTNSLIYFFNSFQLNSCYFLNNNKEISNSIIIFNKLNLKLEFNLLNTFLFKNQNIFLKTKNSLLLNNYFFFIFSFIILK